MATTSPARSDARRHPDVEDARLETSRWTRPPLILSAGLAVSILLLLASVTIGSMGISLGEVVRAVGMFVTGGAVPAEFQNSYSVITGLRLPRAILAFGAGAALSLAGVLMQALLRNPLVSPFTLGVSPAAAFGAATVIFFLGGKAANGLVALGAVTTALLVSALLLGFTAARRLRTSTLLLLGIALTQLFEAMTSALQFAADENTLQQIVRWTFGSVNEADWLDVGWVWIMLAIALPLALRNSMALNAVAFAGDDAAKSLGVNVDALRVGLIGLAVLLASIVVSTCGVIGFVGLVGPHIARIIISADHRFLLPFSALTGGLLVLVSDAVGRTVLAPSVIPVGIVVAAIGAPMFIHLVLRRRGASS